MSELIPNEWITNAKSDHRKKQSEEIKARGGQKCSNCRNMREHAYTKKIVSCILTNFGKIKRTSWCQKWEAKIK